MKDVSRLIIGYGVIVAFVAILLTPSAIGFLIVGPVGAVVGGAIVLFAALLADMAYEIGKDIIR